MFKQLWCYAKKNLTGFWSGAIGGCAVWGIILFPVKIVLSSVVLDTIGKLMMVGALAIITGLFKVLGEDFYKQHIKNRLFKVKKDDNGQKSDNEKAA